MQHTETRWLTMKYVAVRVLQQWKSFDEYFLKFLPKKSNFKSTVANTDRYQRICAALQDPLTEAYTSFCAYSTSTEFKDFFFSFNQLSQKYACSIFPRVNLFQIRNKSLFGKSCCVVWIQKIF